MYKRVLAVVDDRSVSESAARQAIEIARVNQAELLLLYILPPPNNAVMEFPAIVTSLDESIAREARVHASQILSKMSAMAEAGGVHSQRAMGQGQDEAGYVAEVATKRQCDLIVVGADHQNAVMRLIGGSIVPGLITRATVPVLVCKENPKAKPRRPKLPLHQRSPEQPPHALL